MFFFSFVLRIYQNDGKSLGFVPCCTLLFCVTDARKGRGSASPGTREARGESVEQMGRAGEGNPSPCLCCVSTLSPLYLLPRSFIF